MTWLTENAPTVVDGSGERYRVVGMQAIYTLQSVQTGKCVACNQRTLADLGVQQQALLQAFAQGGDHSYTSPTHGSQADAAKSREVQGES